MKSSPKSAVTITELPNGDTVLEAHMKTKRIRGADGRFVTLYSYDGETWGSNAAQMRNRLERGERLHPGHMAKIQEPLVSGTIAREPAPMLMQMPEHIGETRTRDRAKRPRRIHERDVKIRTRPVHSHRCHDGQYPCSCDTPWKKRPCGGTHCLLENNQTLHDKIVDLSKAYNAGRIR